MGDREFVQAVLADVESAAISEREKALLAFVEKVARAPHAVTQEDVDAAKNAGWPDEALYDAVTVCALFKFYNTWVDGTGVEAMTDAGYSISAKRLVARGYG